MTPHGPAPRPPRHLHVFGVSLVVLLACLAVVLFGVRMEAVAPATGVVTSRDLVELRARRPGLVELGRSAGAGGGRLRPGDEVAAGQLVASVAEEGAAGGRLLAPDAAARWQVVKVPVLPGQAAAAGQLVASLVPLDAEGGQPLGLEVRLDVDEKHFAEVAVGQEVRLFSAMYPHRIHGVARARVERLEPLGEAGPNGTRRFHAVAAVTERPFPLKLGSSVRAELVLGRKRTYRIILEH